MACDITENTQPRRILAISSGGGHWEQLMIVSAAFDGHDVSYVSTMKGSGDRFGISKIDIVADCNRNKPMANIKCALDLLALLRQIRPDVVITTGAAPGLIAIALGRLMGAHTIWIDSVANSEELSMSGKLAKIVASTRVTQWEHLSTDGIKYWGSVL